MKRIAKFLAAFSIWEMVGRHPILASILLLGTGAGGVAVLNTPTITPQPSVAFTQSNTASTNVSLKTNGGTAGAFYMPNSDVLKSWALYTEMQVDPSFVSSFHWPMGVNGQNTLGMQLTTSLTPGFPVMTFQEKANGSGNTTYYWWQPTGGQQAQSNQQNGVHPNNSFPGYYTVQAATGCPSGNGWGARESQWVFRGDATYNVNVDPGFLCGGSASGGPASTMASISGIGTTQTVSTLSCASNTPVSGEYQVTVTTPVANGAQPGHSFTLAGFTPSGYNQTYAAAAGTSGATLIGISKASGTCPAAVSVFGTVGNGSGGTAPNFNGLGAQAAAGNANSTTGIQFAPNQRACVAVGEFGDDSPFPGAQFAYATDIAGNALPGSPALSPWLNQGTASFNGYVTFPTTQSPSTPALTVTSMNSFSITAASYSAGTGYVTFTTSANSGLIIGSEFTVSGVTPSGYNQTYVAVAGTSGTTLVGNPLNQPVGIPQTISAPGSYVSGGSLVSVIMPGMTVLGASGYAYIAPYGQYGGTGQGGTGTYGLSANPATYTFTIGTVGSGQMTVTGTPGTFLVVGTDFTINANNFQVTGQVSGTPGLAGVYNVNTTTGMITGTATANGLWSSGTPGVLWAAESYYANVTPNSAVFPSSSSTMNVAQSLHSASTLGDVINTLGSQSQGVNGATSAGGWGGNLADVGMYSGVWPNANGSPLPSEFNAICGKTKDFQQFASDNGGAWQTLYRLSDGGIFADSSLAQITGYISGASGSTATLHVSTTVNGTSTAFGSGATVAGPGVAGCPSTCPTVTSGSGASYTITFTGSAANAGSSGSTIAMSVGTQKPAAPLNLTSLTGSISGNTLTVTNITEAVHFTGILSGTTLTTSAPTGTIAIGQFLYDGGSTISPTMPLVITGGLGSSWTVATNYYGSIASETMYGTPGAIIPGQWLLGAGVTTPVMITGYGTLTPCATNGFAGCGTYTLSNSANGTIGSQTFNTSGVSAGGAIAPGAALTADNPGLGVIYPITNYASSPMVGSLILSGTYNTGLLGGTPSAIQAQVSATPQGPPVSGCSACAWTNLSSPTLGAGVWTGQAINIPAGGPYWVSLRAANGTAYATLPNAVFVGVNIGVTGEGNAAAYINGGGQSLFQGFGNLAGYQTEGAAARYISNSTDFVPGPAILNNYRPSTALQQQVDRFSVGSGTQALGEGTATLIQNASLMMGGSIPIGLGNMQRNGTFFNAEWYDNVTATQTVGIGDGSSTTFTSGAGYGGVVGGTSPTAATVSSVTATINTSGDMNVTNVNGFLGIATGDQVCVPQNCSTYSGVIVGQGYAAPYGGSPWNGSFTLTGFGGTGHYAVSPGQTVGSTTVYITHNNLLFNSAYLYGAAINGTVSAGVLTVNSLSAGAMSPLMSVTDGTNSAILNACLSNCDPTSAATSTWALSNSTLNGDTAVAMWVRMPNGSSVPVPGSTAANPNTISIGVEQSAGTPMIRHGTLQIFVNGTLTCQDTTGFVYNGQSGVFTCTGAGSSSWVNYATGAYSIVFASAPAANAKIVAQWTNLETMSNSGALENLGWVGDGTLTGGALSAVVARTGGLSANLWAMPFAAGQWPALGLNIAKLNNNYFANQVTAYKNTASNLPLLFSGDWRIENSQFMYGNISIQQNADAEEYEDAASQVSTFNGYIDTAAGSGPYSAILHVTSAITGAIWEGEVLECASYNVVTCGLPAGTEITQLNSGTFGASGSSYVLSNPYSAFTNTPGGAGGAYAMSNALYYAPGNGVYIGPNNDVVMQVTSSPAGNWGAIAPETQFGPFGFLRTGQRGGLALGAALAGTPSKAAPVTVSRAKPTACDAAATSSPCFDIGSTYQASAAATWSGSTFTITGGLSAGSRPFVPGMALSCSGCNTGLVAISVSLPPTQSTVAGQGQIGQTFTVSASGTIGGGGSGTLNGGCKGTSGTGSNCIDVVFNINTAGTYSGAAASLNTCGANNIVGSNSNVSGGIAVGSSGNYITPNGTCVPTGAGAIVGNFRIGTSQLMDQPQITTPQGTAWDMGADLSIQNGSIYQSEAFSCHIVAATIVQCVHGPVYSAGTWSLGSWLSAGPTYVAYGDTLSAGWAGGMQGNAGGQSFPFTAGSGYTLVGGGSTGSTAIGGSCPTLQAPPAMQVSIASGAIADVYPSTIGYGVISACSFPTGFSFTGTVTSGATSTLTIPSQAITATGTIAALGTTINITGGAGMSGLQVGSVLRGSGGIYPLVITACVTTCGTAGNYTVQNNNSVGSINAATTTWTTSSVIGSAIVPGLALFASGNIPAGSVISTTTTPGIGQDGTYTITCNGSCTAGSSITISAGLTAGSGGAITTPPLSPIEGVGGIATFDSDSNKLGLFLYDNSGAVNGNPLWGCFQLGSSVGLVAPGMGTKPFGQRRGAMVSG